MIPHPSVWLDNPDTRQQELSMWKKLLGWILKFAPSIAQAVMEAKAREAAEKAAAGKE